jgi:hypothetical protein
LKQEFSAVSVSSTRDTLQTRVAALSAQSCDWRIEDACVVYRPYCRHIFARLRHICIRVTSTPAHAFGTHHAFCLTGDEWPGLSNCTFDTYAQSQASSSGGALTCIANPYFGDQSDDPYAYQNRSRTQSPGYWSR